MEYNLCLSIFVNNIKKTTDVLCYVSYKMIAVPSSILCLFEIGLTY